MSDQSKKTGTREWSEHSFNCCVGCAHGCLYCYARMHALRYGQIKRGQDWTTESCRERKVGKLRGVVMFPTTHDYTQANFLTYIDTLSSLLDKGNRVLVVTKAGTDVMCHAGVIDCLQDFPSDQSELRVTLSCWAPEIRKFWEPGAPAIADRFSVLKDAFRSGLRTSVSMEPWLDGFDEMMACVSEATPFVSETIWIGKANKLYERTRWVRNERPELVPQLEQELARIAANQSDERVMRVYQALKDNPKVRWKDSYAEVIQRCGAN